MKTHHHRKIAATFIAWVLRSVGLADETSSPLFDLVVYGESSGAFVAAVSAKREGRFVFLVNPVGFPGGMSSSGLGATDLGRRGAIGGIASEFYEGIARASHFVQHYITERGHAQSDGVIWRVPPRPCGNTCHSIIPRKGERENLCSTICLSASHTAQGSIRIEPVFMALSESAAIAAGMAIGRNTSVQEVAYTALREKLEAAKQIVCPEACMHSGKPQQSTPENNQ